MNIYIVKKENSNNVIMVDYVLAEKIKTKPYSNLIEFYIGKEAIKIVNSTSVGKLEGLELSHYMEIFGAKNQVDLFTYLKQRAYHHFA